MDAPLEEASAPAEYTSNGRGTIIASRVFLALDCFFLVWATGSLLWAIFGFSVDTYIVGAFSLYFCLSVTQMSFARIAIYEEVEMAALTSAIISAVIFLLDVMFLIVTVSKWHLLLPPSVSPSHSIFPLALQTEVLVAISLFFHFASFILHYYFLAAHLESIDEY